MCKLIYKFKALSKSPNTVDFYELPGRHSLSACQPPSRSISFIQHPPGHICHPCSYLFHSPLRLLHACFSFRTTVSIVSGDFCSTNTNNTSTSSHFISSHRLNQYTTKQKMANVFEFYEPSIYPRVATK